MDLFVLALALLGLILICALGFLIYSGLLSTINITVCRPPVGELKVFYKFCTGPYQESCSVFNELNLIVPLMDHFGIYYSDPKVVESSKLKYAVGAVLPNGTEPFKILKDQLLAAGFKSFTFPQVERSIVIKYPLKNRLSLFIAIHRVYPKLQKFMEKNKLKVEAVLEYYKKDCVYFYVPLEKMKSFLVPEAI